MPSCFLMIKYSPVPESTRKFDSSLTIHEFSAICHVNLATGRVANGWGNL